MAWSIPAQITNFFATSPIAKSALTLPGLVLFSTTLLINFIARRVIERSTGRSVTPDDWRPPPGSKRPRLTATGEHERAGGDTASVAACAAVEMGGARLCRASGRLWRWFSVAGVSPVGGVLVSGFLTCLGVLRDHRLARHGISGHRTAWPRWRSGGSARRPLPSRRDHHLRRPQGRAVVFNRFPPSWSRDIRCPRQNVSRGAAGRQVVGTFEQVGLATLYTVPIAS